MVGFVGNSNGQINSFNEDDTISNLHALIQKARINAIQWSNLIHAKGRELELAKCSYHVMYWKFSTRGAPVLSNVQSEIRPIEVPDRDTNHNQTLEYLSPSVAHKILGHYKEPTGIQKMQFRQLKAKSDSITASLWSTPLTRD